MTNSLAEKLAARAKASETKRAEPEIEREFPLTETAQEISVDDIQLGDFGLSAVDTSEQKLNTQVERAEITNAPLDMSSLRISKDEIVIADDKPIVRDGLIIHVTPRKTILDMLANSKLDENYVFYTRPNSGEDYVQAMRQLLSRTRKKAKQDKLTLKQDFKLYTIEVVTVENKYDRVTLLRSMSINHRFNSHFDEIMNALNGA